MERAALGAVLVLLVAELFGLGGTPLAVLALSIAVVHIVRLAPWDTRATLRMPLLWVLHFDYAWIPLHLLLRVAGEAG